MSQQRRRLDIWTVLALMVPFAALAVIFGYGVNAPFFDDFLSPGEMLVRRSRGELAAGDFIAQHNEHRILFPRLVFMALASASGGWNPRWQMLASWVSAWAILYAVWRLGSSGLALFVSSVLLFSVVQFQNWTWGMQLMMFLPVACVALALVALRQPGWDWRVRLAAAAVLAVVATFSAGSGMLAWLVLIPSLRMTDCVPVDKRRLVLGVWLAGFAICAAIYFGGYSKPPTASLTHALEHPLDAVYWFLAFLGSPLAWVSGPGAASAAAVTLAGFAMLCRTSPRSSLPWLTMALYSVAVAASATLARSGDGIGQALSARYSTLVLPLYVAAVNLVGVTIPGNRALAAAGLLLLLHLFSCVRAFPWMEDFWRERRHGRACMVWSGQVESKDCLASAFPGRGPLISPLVEELHKLGHLPFPRAANPSLPAAIAPATGNSKGWFDQLDRLPDGRWRATGWAARHDRYRGPDAVLIAYRRGEGAPVVVGVSTAPLDDRGDVQEFSRHPKIGWQAHFPNAALPPGKISLRAYAFTIRQRANAAGAWEFLLLPGEFEISSP